MKKFTSEVISPMIRELRSALAACLVTFALCAVVYPAAVWGFASVAFPYRSRREALSNAMAKSSGRR